MKKLLLLAAMISLFSLTGCVVAEDRHRHHDDVIVAPAVDVRPPEVIVR
jgi:hypothetical protein